MTDDHGDIERLRKLILQVINEEFRQKQDRGIPTGWLLLHLLLRNKYQDRGWCTKEECAPIAKSCGIKVMEKGNEMEGENELPQVLHAIHENYGTILYYSCLPNLVICDPNVILWPLKSVFEFVFACNSCTKYKIANRIRNTREISEKVLNTCFETSNLPTADIVTLFKHRLILCEPVEKGVEKYFIPCLLRSNHAIAKEVQDLASLDPAPILFVPQSKSCHDSPSPCTWCVLSSSSRYVYKMESY